MPSRASRRWACWCCSSGSICGVWALSALTEDAVVFIKLIVLCAISAIGVWHFSAHRLAPLSNRGVGGLVLGAASIFVAYEGFELLAYDYDDIEDPSRTLPRALYLSVIVVVAVYIVVTLGSQMLVSDALIVSQKEVAFATVGREALGSAGRWIATFAALLATCSAINATLFSSARQMRDLADANELPVRLDREVNGLPVAALALLTVLGSAFAMLPGILEVLAFGSATFLAVFALVNYLAARAAQTWLAADRRVRRQRIVHRGDRRARLRALPTRSTGTRPHRPVRVRPDRHPAGVRQSEARQTHRPIFLTNPPDTSDRQYARRTSHCAQASASGEPRVPDNVKRLHDVAPLPVRGVLTGRDVGGS